MQHFLKRKSPWPDYCSYRHVKREFHGKQQLRSAIQKMNSLHKRVALVAALAGLSVVARANPELYITDSAGDTAIVDTTVLPNGTVTYSGSIGLWNITVDTGVSASPIGNIDLLGDESYSGSGAASISIAFSDTGFSLPGTAVASIGGTFDTGTTGLTFNTYYGTSLLDETNPLTSQSFSGTGSFSGNQVGGNVTNAPYSLTEVVTITNSGANPSQTVTSFDAGLNVPDGGTTALLLGVGLLGLALAARKFKRSSLI
jgi:VPDSG-CTERM motif